MKTPGTPKRGNEVNVIGISLGFRCLRARFRLEGHCKKLKIGAAETDSHLYRMLDSTERRSRMEPV